MVILLIEHILSTCAAFFRKYDIQNNAKVDINGLKRAPRESFLSMIQVFFNCILFGYVAKLMSDQNADDFHHQAYVTYWIMIDIIIMFFTNPYIVLCQKFQVDSEITKNIYTLFFV